MASLSAGQWPRVVAQEFTGSRQRQWRRERNRRSVMSTPSSQSALCPIAHAQVVDRTLRRAGRRSGQTRRAKPAIDRPMRHWLNTFHQLHTEGATYTPVALRLDADAVHHNGDAAIGCTIDSAPQLAIDRFAYEVALRRDSRGET